MSTTLFLGKAAIVSGTEIDFKTSTLKMGSSTVAPKSYVDTEVSTLNSTINSKDSAMDARMVNEIDRAKDAEEAIGVRIDKVLSNIDASALDSLTELVTAFQAADSSLSGSITALSNSATSNLDAEAVTARAAEVALGIRIDGEKTRGETAEALVQSHIDSEAVTARAAELFMSDKLKNLYEFLFKSDTLVDPYGSSFNPNA
jgi:hypothetical protein